VRIENSRKHFPESVQKPDFCDFLRFFGCFRGTFSKKDQGSIFKKFSMHAIDSLA
jgi:hypothetical protein